MVKKLVLPSLSSSSKAFFELYSSSTPPPPVAAASSHRCLHLTRALSSSNHKMEAGNFTFGPYKIDKKEVFYSTHLSYAMINLRPLLPDVLVCPRREVKRFIDLTTDETSDLWITAQKIGRQLESHHKASSLTFVIQVNLIGFCIVSGWAAGQTVPHVHIHVLPWVGGDFENNDEIYDAIDEKEKELKQTLNLDKERKDRSMEEMSQEADEYRKLFS